MAYNVPKQIVVLSSSNINLKATGNTIIFTPATAFVVTAIIAYGVSLTGSISVPIANIGFTGPNYDDIVSGFTNFSNATGFLYEGNALGIIPFVPAGTALRINVTTADATATTNTQRIDILGYYL